jgi:hypothetical protein
VFYARIPSVFLAIPAIKVNIRGENGILSVASGINKEGELYEEDFVSRLDRRFCCQYYSDEFEWSDHHHQL